MTDQRDPKRDPMYRARLRRESGEWNIWPLLLGGVFVIIFGYMLFAPNSDTDSPMQQTRIEQTNPTNAPGTTKTPTPAPPAATPPK